MHAESARLAETSSAAHWLNGVPMHWMRDWSTPHPLFVRKARGVEVEDVDGNTYIDFCFGDTGAMFGHSPPAIARALAETGAMGITSMLPVERVAHVGENSRDLWVAVLADNTTVRHGRESRGVALGTRRRGAAAHPGLRRLLSRHGGQRWCAPFLTRTARAAPHRAGLIGMNHEVSVTTDAVPFDGRTAAVERVLSARPGAAAVIASSRS